MAWKVVSLFRVLPVAVESDSMVLLPETGERYAEEVEGRRGREVSPGRSESVHGGGAPTVGPNVRYRK